MNSCKLLLKVCWRRWHLKKTLAFRITVLSLESHGFPRAPTMCPNDIARKWCKLQIPIGLISVLLLCCRQPSIFKLFLLFILFLDRQKKKIQPLIYIYILKHVTILIAKCGQPLHIFVYRFRFENKVSFLSVPVKEHITINSVCF